METYQIGLLGFPLLILLIALRVPIAFALTLVGIGGLLWLSGPDATFNLVSGQLYSSVAMEALAAVPLFLMMGEYAHHAGLTRAAFDTARLWLAPFPGGLAMATVAGCALFGACSGSAIAAAGAMGRITIPEMLRNNYDKRLATGSVAAAATLDTLIPPSIIMVIYAVLTDQSIGRMMLAGYLPGVLTAVLLIGTIYVRVKRNPKLAPAVPFTASWRERLIALKEVWGITALILLILGGIYSGFVTATEAGALGAFGALVLMVGARELNWLTFRGSIFETARTTGMIFLLMIGAALFSRFMAVSGAPAKLAELITGWGLSVMAVVVLVCVVYIFLGMFLDSISMMLLTLPVLQPVLTQMQVDFIWFGILVVKLVEIGCITPPFGITVYVVKGVVGDTVTLEEIFQGIGWFLVAELITLALLFAFPQISLVLPNAMLGTR